MAALVWANIGSSYEHVWHTTLTIRIGGAGISQDLRHWVNNGLMTFFFFVTGLEARREFDLGDLRDRRRLLLPLLAGLGGMIAPGRHLPVVQRHRKRARRLGRGDVDRHRLRAGDAGHRRRRFPDSLRAFVLTVAVVDDLVALVVIAIAFTTSVQGVALAVGSASFVVMLIARRGWRPQRGGVGRARRRRLGGVPEVRDRSAGRGPGHGAA